MQEEPLSLLSAWGYVLRIDAITLGRVSLNPTPTTVLAANLLELPFILLGVLLLVIRLFESLRVCLVAFLFLLTEVDLSHRL